jgi:plastocyanin
MNRSPRIFLAAALSLGAATAGLSATASAAPLAVTVTDSAGKPLEGAIVTVSVPGAPKVAPPGTTAQMAQQNRQFSPQIIVVQAGTSVNFPNLDTVRHHVYSFSPIKPFELKLYAGTPAAPIVFDKVGTAVLGCNIHDRMSGWVVVVDTPYFAKTDAAGQARIDVPEGEHVLHAWHPQQTDSATPVERRVKAGTPVSVQLSFAQGA